MGISYETLAASRKYTDDSLVGVGALAGKPCQIQSITPITGGNRVTFLWVDDNSDSHTSTMDVMNGAQGDPGDPGDPGAPGSPGQDGVGIKSLAINSSNHLIVTLTDNNTVDAGEIPAVQSDWDQSDSSASDFIKNKPTLGTAAAKNSTGAVTEDSTDLVESGAVFAQIGSWDESVTSKTYAPIINITDALGVNAKDVKVKINPVQEGSGDPSLSNVRAITGWDSVNIKASAATAYTDIEQGSFDQNGNDGAVASANRVRNHGYLPVKKDQSYIISAETDNLYVNISFFPDDAHTEKLSSTPWVALPYVFTIPEGCNFIRFMLSFNEGEQSPISPSDVTGLKYGLCNDVTIDLDGTRYGGVLDVTTGVLTVDKKLIDLGSFTWTKQNSASPYWRFTARMVDMMQPATANDPLRGICSCYKAISANQSWNNVTGIATQAGVIMICDTSISTPEDLKTAMTGQTCCYELATPFTVQLVPTGVKLLEGNNAVYANTGDIFLEYRTPSLGNLGGAVNDVAAKAQTIDGRLHDEVSARALLGAHNLVNYDAWKQVGTKDCTAIWENNGVTLTASANDAWTNYNTADFNNAGVPVVEGETYVLTWDVDESGNKGNVIIFPNGAAVNYVYTGSNRKRLEYTVPSGVTYITWRFGVATSGDTVHYKNVQISVKDDTYGKYLPYAMTNRELTDIKEVIATANSTYINADYLTFYKSGRVVTCVGYFTVNAAAARYEILYTLAETPISDSSNKAYLMAINNAGDCFLLKFDGKALKIESMGGIDTGSYALIGSFLI